MIRSGQVIRAALIVGCLIAAGSPPVLAQQRAPQGAAPVAPAADAVAAARELMTVSGVAKQFDAMLPAMMAQMTQAFVQMQPQHEKVIRETLAQVSKRGLDRKGELIDEVAKLYAREISAADMQELTRFFKSAAGQRFVEAQMKILPDAMRVGQQWGEKIGREIDTEMRNELRKKGIPI